MTPSQFDPLAEAPRSLRARIARKFGRTVEPMAVRLLSWCRSLDHRVESIEGRIEAGEAQLRSVSHAVRGVEGLGQRLEAIEEIGPKIEALLSKIAAMSARLKGIEALPEKIRAIEARTDQTFWGREALSERMNQDDVREQVLVERISGLEVRADQLHWGREALVERMNRDDATVEAIDRRVLDFQEALDRRIVALQQKVEAQFPLPTGFGLDYIAMGRRLASLEDQVELLLARAQDGQSATLVAFPGPEKAAG